MLQIMTWKYPSPFFQTPPIYFLKPSANEITCEKLTDEKISYILDLDTYIKIL